MKVVLTKNDIYNGNLILVNANNPINNLFKIDKLESFNNEYIDIKLNSEVNKYLQFILNEIDDHNDIVPVSAYRSFMEQNNLYNDSLLVNGFEFTSKYVAYPNTSEHQTGLAIDLAIKQEQIDFICPSFPRVGICQKFREIASNYGFIERYKKDKEDITLISEEQWHFRFVGYPHSKYIEEHNLCLEEYIELLKNNNLYYLDYEITYIPYTKPIVVDLNDVSVSGNNIDGFIITRKLKSNN